MADSAAFFDYVQQYDRFDLMEKRASKTAVREFVEQNNGDTPPGVNFGSVAVMNVRAKK